MSDSTKLRVLFLYTEVAGYVVACLRANGMRDGAHIRLTLTRGKQVTSGMSPHWNQYGPCLIVPAEWKPPVFDAAGASRLGQITTENVGRRLELEIFGKTLGIVSDVEPGHEDVLRLWGCDSARLTLQRNRSVRPVDPEDAEQVFSTF